MAVLYEINFLGMMLLNVVVRFMDYAFGQIHVTIYFLLQPRQTYTRVQGYSSTQFIKPSMCGCWGEESTDNSYT